MLSRKKGRQGRALPCSTVPAAPVCSRLYSGCGGSGPGQVKGGQGAQHAERSAHSQPLLVPASFYEDTKLTRGASTLMALSTPDHLWITSTTNCQPAGNLGLNKRVWERDTNVQSKAETSEGQEGLHCEPLRSLEWPRGRQQAGTQGCVSLRVAVETGHLHIHTACCRAMFCQQWTPGVTVAVAGTT